MEFGLIRLRCAAKNGLQTGVASFGKGFFVVHHQLGSYGHFEGFLTHLLLELNCRDYTLGGYALPCIGRLIDEKLLCSFDFQQAE